MKQKTLNILITVFSVVIMCAFVVLAILYAEGYYDFSFIDRQTEPSYQTEPTEDTQSSAQTSQEPEQTEPEATLPGETTGEPVIPAGEDSFDYDSLHAQYPEYSGVGKPTEDDYDASAQTLVRLTGLPKVSLLYSGMMNSYTDFIAKNDNLRVFSVVMSRKNRPSVGLYMGYIIVTQGQTMTFYSGKGQLLLTYTMSAETETDGEEQTPEFPEPIYAYERDKENRPLFLIGGEYYYIDAENGTFEKSDFDTSESRGVHYNYVSALGADPDQCYVYTAGSLYGIKKPDGTRLRTAVYDKAYNYSEGYGLVVYEGDMYYFNEKGKVTIEGYYPVGASYSDSVGAIYYDGGWVRVRKISYSRENTVVEDIDVLIDTAGNEFKLPEGYSLVSVSDQRILVKKGTKYGFYSLKGAWITDVIYTYATPYNEGLAVVGDTNGRKAVIDMDGNFVIPFSYTEISVCSGGAFVCYSEKTGYDVYLKTAVK